MKCVQCANELASDARFCSQCGQPMPTGHNSEGEVSDREMPPASEPRAANRARVYAAAGAGNRDASVASADHASSDIAENEIEDSGVYSGKVMTSPFPALPDTASSQGLPDIALSGQAVHALLAQANLCRMRRQWDEAMNCCVAVLRAQPANQSAHVLLGDIYRDQGRAEDAIQWYGMAVELRPNPTDQAKLDQVTRERERAARQANLRGRRGYDTALATPLDRQDGLNAGTTNLMGVSPRRWLRGITTVSLAFLALVLMFLVWQYSDRIKTPAANSGSKPRALVQQNGAVGLPPHRLDQTLPAHILAQAANGDRTVLVGGGGLPPDKGMRPVTVAARPRTAPGSVLPGNGAFSGRAPLGIMATPNLPTQPIENVRALPPAPQPSVGVAAAAPPSNRLTDGLELTQTLGDGGASATVLLTGPASLVLDGSARGQDTLVRNIYRAARTAFANNTMLMRVKVLVQTQVQGTGLASIVDAETDRGTASNVNPNSDDSAGLRGRLLSYTWSGASAGAGADPSAEQRPLGQ